MRLQLVILRATLLSGILFAVTTKPPFAQTVTIHVRLLDGRTGKNLSGMNLRFVDYHTDPDGSAHPDLNGRMAVKTSVDGDSYIANPEVDGVLVFDGLANNGEWTPCTRQKMYDRNTQSYGTEHLYPVSSIIASGLIAQNDCGRKTAVAKPGELVIFVRRSTWWEKFISAFTS